MDSEQIFDTLTQLFVASAGAFQKTLTLVRRQFQRFGEDIFLDVRVLVHRLRLIEFGFLHDDKEISLRLDGPLRLPSPLEGPR